MFIEEQKLIIYLVFYSLISFIAGGSIYLLLPERYKNRPLKKALFAGIVLFIFLTGPLGLAGTVILYFAIFKRKKEKISIPAEKLSLEETIIPDIEKRSFGEAVWDKLNEKLVLLIAKFPSPRSVQLLKRALSAEEDEIRLIAFSAISRMEKEIFERINVLLKKLEKAKNPDELFRIYSSLAELYWEPVFLNIADEELAEFYLKTALDYGLKALKINEDGKLLFLIGRIYLRLKEYDKAELFLKRAVGEGIPVEKVAPYLMEVYFVKKNWKALRNIARHLKDKTIPDAKALSIIRVWV